MNTKVISILLAAAALPFTATAASAQDSTGGQASAGVTAGTLGIGPELGYRFSERFGVRANATFLSVDRDFDSDGVDYNGKINLKSFGAMLDVYPFGGGFRLSAGARINGNKGRLTATPTGDTEVGDDTFTAAQIGTITGRAETKDFAPQLTLGYGGGLSSGLSFGIEAGALFQGGIRIREFTSNGTLANDADFRAELENERQELQDDVDGFKVYPIVQLGVKYRF